MDYMVGVVIACKHLTKLYVPYITNDNLLEMIGKYCKKLRLLDISGETDITEVGIESISKGVCAKYLTKVDIGIPGEENICYTDIALILQNCTSVETFSTYAFVGKALKFIYDNIDNNFKCRLKYLHDTNSDKCTLHIITHACPQLESLYLDAPLIGCLCELSSISLCKLKLHKFDCSELLQLLEAIGNNLCYLIIIKGIGDFNLSRLSYLCPTELNCYLMDNLYYDHNHHRFRNLKGLEVLSSTIMTNSLKMLICNATHLKTLAVDRISFNDEDIISIFVENDFYQIEDIWFTLAPYLSLRSIEVFIERCPDLQSIGQLSGWSISHEDTVYLCVLLRSENCSLTLEPNGFYP